MRNAIQKAIEGGYKTIAGWYELDGDEVISFDDLGNLILTIEPYETALGGKTKAMVTEFRKEQILLDPLFWQCLGKSLGWKNTMFGKECKECGTAWGEIPEWKAHWHRFIDHLASGGDVDEFFKDLLEANK